MCFARMLGAALCAVSYATGAPAQAVDVDGLIKRMRAATELTLREWPLVTASEFGPGRSGDFFLHWKRGDDRFGVICDQHDSRQEAIRGVRDLRIRISAGVPDPLQGVADEAYYLGPYGLNGTWMIYLARGVFVCQVGGGPEAVTRELADTVVKAIDGI